MKDKNNLDKESRDNLARYALLVWRIFQRVQNENKTETKSGDESLRDEWNKRFKN